MKKEGFIGVFDSGFGGLNVLREIVKEMPEYNYLYYGDSARAPYGSRSQDLIYSFTEEAVEFMFSQGCEIVVLACNTASSEALRKIQQTLLSKKYPNKKVLGVLIPSAEEAIFYTKNNTIGVIATEGTVASEAFVREIKKINKQTQIYQEACPLLVPLIENGEKDKKIIKLILQKYLTPLKKRKIDTLILGCTHYGVFEKEIKKIIGKNIKTISSEKIIPKKLKEYLKKHSEIDKKLVKNKITHFYSSDITDRFAQMGSDLFKKQINIIKIN